VTDEDHFDEHEEPSDGIRADIAVLKAKVRMLSWLVKNELVSKYEFAPVKLIAFGIAGLVISSVLVAVLSYVLRKV